MTSANSVAAETTRAPWIKLGTADVVVAAAAAATVVADEKRSIGSGRRPLTLSLSVCQNKTNNKSIIAAWCFMHL